MNITIQNTLYGSHVCGEGGEYETLTLDCPLFKQRIKLYVLGHLLIFTFLKRSRTNTETVIHSDNDFATVAFLRIKEAVLEPKSNISRVAAIPPLLDEHFKNLEKTVLDSQNDSPSNEVFTTLGLPQLYHPNIPSTSSRRKGRWVVVSNVQSENRGLNGDLTIEEEVKQCFHIVAGTFLVFYINKFSHETQNNLRNMAWIFLIVQ